ncbi:uncharacterized protein mus304 [Hetaerina americana]|uniref:uncharacterized protein mus304 n=1 Tax=Hetaerina americana TaxID=62018 RepID=UPI003A7F485E
MANQKKRFEFENTFGSSSRSPKRPKLEVIQKPSTSGSRNESFENVDENDDLWGDELESDVVQEVIQLESQAFPLMPPVPKCEPTLKSSASIFKPKTATAFTKRVTGGQKGFVCHDAFRDSGSSIKETKFPERRMHDLQVNVTGEIKPLAVENVKSHAVGRGCSRSNSMPTVVGEGRRSKPWSEIENLSRKLVDNSTLKTQDQCDPPIPVDNSEDFKALQKEIERLKSEAFSKAGEAALLRQKVKEAALDLEREKSYRATLLEKTNQKHQQEVLALNRELEAAKTQLQFKEHDVDKAIEKCKLLEAGNLKVKPMELKLHTTLRPSNTSDFPNRSTFEDSTPKKRAHSDFELKSKQNAPKAPEATTSKVVVTETGVQTEDKSILIQESLPNMFSRLSEGEMLSQLIVPVWFEMDSNATEEHFENKREGIEAITELLKMTVFQGQPLERLADWCWKRMLEFLFLLQNKSVGDSKSHQIQKESRRQYEEWCLDRRIPLPPQEQSQDDGFIEDWFCDLAENSFMDELQCLMSYRPWCPSDLLPEIRRALALIAVLVRVSKNMALVFSSHNQKTEEEDNICHICGTSMQVKSELVQADAVDGHGSVRNSADLRFEVGESPSSLKDNSSAKTHETEFNRKCSTPNKTCDNKTEQEIDGEPKDFLKYDFLLVVQQICKVISGMREIRILEGTLAGILAFLSSLSENVALSRRAVLVMSAVVKHIIFINPHLRVLPLLMRLLSVTGEYPLMLQKLCVNSAWDTSYQDKFDSVWMFNEGVCPLQILITILGNVVDEDNFEGVNRENWYKFRTRIAIFFLHWLDAALTQPGHQVDWLCYVTNDEVEVIERKSDAAVHSCKESSESVEKVVELKKTVSKPGESRVEADEIKPSTSGLSHKKKSDDKRVIVEQGEKLGDDENADEDTEENVPYKSLSKLSISKSSSRGSGNENVEEKQPSKKCCCRRWIINILVNILYAVLCDFQSIISPEYEYTVMEEDEVVHYNASKTIILNKKLEHDQSFCIRLGLFILRALHRRDHPELNTPSGEGFLWNHYTVKGSVLINGQIMRKDYSHKNTHGGPVGARYVLFLSKIEKELKGKIKNFCPETEKALQELLEVENFVQSPSEDDDDEEEEEEGEEVSNMWDVLRSIGYDEETQ